MIIGHDQERECSKLFGVLDKLAMGIVQPHGCISDQCDFDISCPTVLYYNYGTADVGWR